MSTVVREKTTVVAIGGGASGLTIGNMFKQAGIACIVLESRSRAYVEQRQRAGIVELRAVHMFHRWGLGDVIVGPPYDGNSEVRINGQSRHLIEDRQDAPGMPPARFCPQQALVRGLLAKLADGGGDIRFEVSNVHIAGVTSQPVVSYVDKDGVTHEIECDYVAGCDGFQGVSRSAIPNDVLKTYSMDYGVNWLSVLVDIPPPRELLIAVSDHGYACHIGRGPKSSRIYLECPVTDTVEDWSDERFWTQLRLRTGDANLAAGPITEKAIVQLRACVFEPMSYGRLFLVGDAAHIIVPVGGKGMNLALRDAELFVLAVQDKLKNGNDAGLKGYSDACLGRVWKYQEFSLDLADAFHAAGSGAGKTAFFRKVARARLERMLTSPATAKLYGELMAGVD